MRVALHMAGILPERVAQFEQNQRFKQMKIKGGEDASRQGAKRKERYPQIAQISQIEEVAARMEFLPRMDRIFGAEYLPR
ncbi:MAG: hypothetical protein NTV49_04035 [Kiritimatiellaeota bacterium]|nr:hypothetical protein [Kiritimatiellota bacterium]